MSHGVISGFSEVVEWKISDFLSIDVGIDSPCFSLAGCTWYLTVYPRSRVFDGFVSAYLEMDGPETAPKTVTYTLGLKKELGVVEEVIRKPDHTFTKDKLYGDAIALWRIDDLQKRMCELMPSGALTVTCRIERVTLTQEEVAPKPEEVRPHRTKLVELETLSSDFGDVLSEDRKYDVNIDVQGTEFHAHRTVLSARSSVFRAMYEHDTAEAKSGLLTIPDCDADSFADFMRYLYTGRMEEVSFQKAYHLYATAEKYEVQLLKSFCADYLSQNLTTENVCDAVVLADKYGDSRLMASAQDFFNKNYCKIFLTSEWNSLSMSALSLSNKLLTEMATSTLKSA